MGVEETKIITGFGGRIRRKRALGTLVDIFHWKST
jgi:hypothetical protein